MREALFFIGVACIVFAVFGPVKHALETSGYARAHATITQAEGWCQTGPHSASRCSAQQVDKLVSEGSTRAQWRVSGQFRDSEGELHPFSGGEVCAGLTREQTVAGTVFDILYDPENPQSVRAVYTVGTSDIVAGLVGLAALALCFAIYGFSFVRRYPFAREVVTSGRT